MKFKFKIWAVFLVVFFLCENAEAAKIEKAFQALKIYDYFKAKKFFEKSIRKHRSIAAFGLATIYYRSDNPFHNIDSSYRYIIMSDSAFQLLADKKKSYYTEISSQFDYVNILLLKTKISSEFFKRTRKQNTIEAYDNFLTHHPWSNEFYLATHLRDSIAFSKALAFNSSSAMQGFISTYPYSEYINRAKLRYDDLVYAEFTAKGNVASYLEFIEKHPESRHIKDAEDEIYKISTEVNTVDAYSAFLKVHPKNRNTGAAWRKIYQLFMIDFSENRIDEFRVSYPNYPYVSELEVDLRNFKLQLLPFLKAGKYGFMDLSGKVHIEARYEQAGFFHEGLASVMKDGKYGFIDKGNRLVVPFKYESVTDFEKGRSLVELNSRFGMIDRSGKEIFPLDFLDLGVISDGLAFGKRDSLYAYYDIDFNMRTAPLYTEAYAFSDSVAKVEVGDKQAFIDVYGSNVVAPGYEYIEFFSDTLLIFGENALYGLMKRNGEVVIPAQYDKILKPVIDRTMVVLNGKIGYIDLSGNQIVPAQYELFPNYLARGQFNSNLTIIRYKGKYGVIDKNGRVILAASFNDIGEVSSLMAFSKGKEWGFTDLLGKVVIPPSFDYAESFSGGTAVVELQGSQGVIDQKGTVLIPIQYKSVVRLKKSYFIISDGMKFGLCSSKGEVIFPVEFESVRPSEKDLILAIRDDEVIYYSTLENRKMSPLNNE